MWTVHWLHAYRVRKVHKLPGQSKVWRPGQKEAGMCTSKMHTIWKHHTFHKEGTIITRRMLICWKPLVFYCGLLQQGTSIDRCYKQLVPTEKVASSGTNTNPAQTAKVSGYVIIAEDIEDYKWKLLNGRPKQGYVLLMCAQVFSWLKRFVFYAWIYIVAHNQLHVIK